MRTTLLFALLVAYPLAFCLGEEIKLEGGNTIEAKIIEETDTSLKIDFRGITLTYDRDQVEGIDGKPLNTPVHCAIAGDETESGKKITEFGAHGIAGAIIALRNPHTALPPSHWGHPGYENLAFTYDGAVAALVLKATGYQKEAEEILDYFAQRLTIPMKETVQRADTNGVYGILKLVQPKSRSKDPVRAFVNAVNISSARRQGTSRLEFWTTPGPTSFLIFALLNVNKEKYQKEALLLGKALLAMQKENGGVKDGDRAPERIHTEPHMDCYAAFLMLYRISGEEKWKNAADAAYSWFEKNAYDPTKGIIHQGVWKAQPSTIFATDVYSWTMAGPAGDRISTSILKKLTATMLRQSLVKITLSLPDGKNITVTLCDFSNPSLQKVKRVRNGFHPMGSVEWTGGVILALQKNAIRLWNAHDITTARLYKAIAKILLDETKKCFYPLRTTQGSIAFYATAQGIEVGPFGSLDREVVHGWKTPFYYAKSDDERVLTEGGSVVGAWPILPLLGLNPFVLNDPYLKTYSQIPCLEKDLKEADLFVQENVSGRTFIESVPKHIPDARTQIVEPGEFNRYMWLALDKAHLLKVQGKQKQAKEHFKEARKWAERTLANSLWRKLAKRDNNQKSKEVGGIISYPWGITYPENDHYLHYAILRYPLLNEIATAMWALSVTHYELGNFKQSKYWIGRIIEDVPLHQIPDIEGRENDIIRGYWNALLSWEDNPGDYERDKQMSTLYWEILREKKLSTAKPKQILISDKKERRIP